MSLINQKKHYLIFSMLSLIILPGVIAPVFAASASISITSPASDGTWLITTTPTISGTASPSSGKSITSVTYTIDTGSSLTATGTTSWSFTTNALSQGSHSTIVTVHDSGGNTASATRTFNIDSLAPSSAITTTSPTKSNTLAGTASDANTVSLVEVSTDNGSTFSAATGTTSWTFDISALTDGTYQVKIRTTDNAGNMATSSASAIVIDRSAQALSSVTIASDN